jgi:hypothetical protein
MKEAGIGQPSTYSRTVEKLEEGRYIGIEDGTVVMTERGRTLWLDVAPLCDADDAGTADGVPMSLFRPGVHGCRGGRAGPHCGRRC